MSSSSFDDIIARYPGEAPSLRRLEALARDRAERVPDYTTNRLFDLVRPASMEHLVALLDVLVRAGLYRRQFRVESPLGGEIESFDHFRDVPDRLVDVRSGDTIDVDPSLIKVVYMPSR